MNCAEISVEIEGLFDGAINPARQRVIETHLVECPSCSARLDQMRAVRALLRKGTVPPPSPSLDVRVMRAFGERYTSPQAAPAWWRRLVFGTVRVPNAALAVSLVAVCVALFVGVRIGRMSGTQLVMAPPPSSAPIDVPAPPLQINDEVVKRQWVAPRRAALTRKQSGPPASRKVSGETLAQTATTKPLESFMTFSSSDANYSTRAALAGFEPVTGMKVRVIKGEDER